MRKDLVVHFTFAIAFFALTTLYKNWFDLIYLPFWLGGILGTILPDVDHLFYVYIFKPQEATSQQAVSLISRRRFFESWDLLAKTRGERRELIFHTAVLQFIFVIFALFMVTSSSIFARGIVLGFLLHLLIDEVMDLMETKNIDHWFTNLPIKLDAEQQRWWLAGNGLILLIFGLFF